MEPRRLLAADVLPIQVGMVYFEEATGEDEAGDVFELTFQGGAEGTQLTELLIDTDKRGDGALSDGDPLFDIADTGEGVYGSHPLTILDSSGIGSVAYEVLDGGTLLRLSFSGFEAGERLRFSIDVDEFGFPSSNAVVEGAEFEGSLMTATFDAEHYYSTSGTDIFLDEFNPALAASGLDLPPDSYVPPGDTPRSVHTAAAIFPLEQTPLPSALAGTVYVDGNLSNDQEFDEPGIEGVQLELFELIDGQYVSTGRTTTTDPFGDYEFLDLLPGTYRVVETQPIGYESVGAQIGMVDGSPRGTVTSVDVLSDIALLGGEVSLGNDFGEVMPASVSGRVHLDLDQDCAYDEGEPLLAGVTIELFDADGQLLATTLTDTLGEYAFTGLMPGTYSIHEVQPEEYLDACDHVGTAGGSHVQPDTFVGIELGSGTHGERYDFAEIEPSSISGFVYEDDDNDGVLDADENRIVGVTVTLLDAEGQVVATTTTGEKGNYEFTDLRPGVYTVVETQPPAYLDGLDTPGSEGGTAAQDDRLSDIVLPPGTDAVQYNFGELLAVSISGRVHAELNMDCIHDPGEPLLEGVTIYLLDANNNRIAETQTDALGEYAFTDLPPGVYGVEEIQPADYLHGATHAGSEGGQVRIDVISDVTLVGGVSAVNYDFCELVPAKISGYVFQDGAVIEVNEGDPRPEPHTVRDGKRTDDDTPIAGVTLQLGNALGQPITDAKGNPVTTVTDENGYYEFTGLYPGAYTVYQAQPEGYVDGLDTPGTKGGLVNNPNEPLEISALGLFSGELTNDVILRIEVGPGDAAAENNFSEVVYEEIPDEPPPPPPPPLPPPITPPEWNPPQPVFNQPPMMASPAIYTPQVEQLPFGGSAGPAGYTWHLSIINAGAPRETPDSTMFDALGRAHLFDPVTWTGTPLDQGEFVISDGQGRIIQTLAFGTSEATPLVGDFNGDGRDEVALFRDGVWWIDLNGNGIWDEGDLWATLGGSHDRPVTGDWDGDGKWDIGIFGPSWIGDIRAIEAEPGLPDAENTPDGRIKNVPPAPAQATVGYRTMKQSSDGRIRSDLIDHVFRYGKEGDVPIAGDFNGDGVSSIGVFREGVWYLDVDGDGRWSPGDRRVAMGRAGDLPVVGDFNRDGIDEIGLYRDGTWQLDTNRDYRLDAHDKVFEMGGPHDRPVMGDFDGDGVDEAALYRDTATAAPPRETLP